jgi:phosphoribosylformylglycinamidine synthase II
LRESDMNVIETLISESQERMLFVVEHGFESEIENIFDKYDILYANIGRVTEKEELVVKKDSVVLADMPVETVTEAPIIQRPASKPRHIDALRNIASPQEPLDLSETLLTLLTSPTIASKRWIYEQYDHEVGVRTVVKPGQSGASVLRLNNNKLLAVTVDGNPKHCYLDPYHGAAGGLAEACRNIISVGGEPVAMVDHCQFGDPGDPEVFWTFNEAVRGMSDYGRELDLPCVGGKVSFYNEDVAAGTAIKPSPIVAVIGLIEDVNHIRRAAPQNKGDLIVILGDTKSEMGGSEYYEYIHQLTGGEVPKVDFEAEKRLWKTVLEGIRNGLIDAATDCSEGGLAVALAEMSIAGKQGVKVDLDAVPSTCKRLDNLLFSESHGRLLVSVDEKHVKSLVELAKNHGVPCNIIGLVEGNSLIIRSDGHEVVSLPLENIRKSWSEAIPSYMGENH